jgi:apolipoprotein N-acyltransferase
LTHYGGLSLPLAIVLATLLAAYLGLYHALFGWLGAPLWRRYRAGGSGGAGARRPAGAVGGARMAAHLFHRRLPVESRGLRLDRRARRPAAVSAFVGAYGVSFLVMLVAVGIAATGALLAARRPRAWRPLIAAVALPLVLLPAAARWSLPRAAVEKLRATFAGVPVRLLQPNVADQVGFDAHQALLDYRHVVQMSYAACTPGALVVWPESAGWPFEYHRDRFLDRDLQSMVDRGCGVVFNTDTPVAPGAEQAYNSAWLLSPTAAPTRYDKRHLVPFGEYVPLEQVLFFAKTVARNVGQFRPAAGLALLPWRGELLGPAICYEVVFPEETAALTRAGATILISVVNDGWYGDTAAPWQHLRAARFRAAENRRPLLRAAITGVSAVIAPDGSVLGQLAVGDEGVLRANVAGERLLTPYARWPWLPPLAATLIAVAALATVYTSRSRN